MHGGFGAATGSRGESLLDCSSPYPAAYLAARARSVISRTFSAILFFWWAPPRHGLTSLSLGGLR